MSTETDTPPLTIEELAAYYRTGKDWIEKGCQKRELPFRMIAGQYRFTVADRDAITEMKAVRPKTIPTRDEVAAKRQRRAAA